MFVCAESGPTTRNILKIRPTSQAKGLLPSPKRQNAWSHVPAWGGLRYIYHTKPGLMTVNKQCKQKNVKSSSQVETKFHCVGASNAAKMGQFAGGFYAFEVCGPDADWHL